MNTYNFSRMRFAMLGATAAISAASFAGDIYADYSFAYQQNAKFTTDFGSVVNRDQSTVQFKGDRTGGSDTLVPDLFDAYCAELGETIGAGNNYHPDVFPLLGSSTNGGGDSGPVFFDAVRTLRLECLWGSFFGFVGTDSNLSAAFQLAQWELCFDNDATLVYQVGARLWVDNVDFQPGITDVAQGWLNAIVGGTATQKTSLLLLTGPNIQDQITPVPEPATIGALGIGLAAAIRRRRKK